MENNKKWEERVEAAVNHYLSLNDGGFDENMKACYVDCDEKQQSITIGFETQRWQMNERGDVHGGAIAGMFDTGLGIVANFIAGKNEAATTDMNVSFMRPVLLEQHCNMIIYIVKAGRSLIRLRAELICVETGKQVAAGSGSWLPL